MALTYPIQLSFIHVAAGMFIVPTVLAWRFAPLR
jgi:hypothetical protein